MEIPLNTTIISTWFLYFMVYSFLGWLAETFYCSALQQKIVERGFLTGPYCPIYGFGAIIVLILLDPYISHPLLLFFLGMILTSILEYAASYIMEKLFHMRWWDYSEHRFNINGRVCLWNSTLFGILCLVLTLLVHPPITEIIGKIPSFYLYIVSSLILLVFTVDCIYSVRATIKLSNHLIRIENLQEKIRAELEELKEELAERRDEKNELFKNWLKENSQKGDNLREAWELWQNERKDHWQERKTKWESRLETLKRPIGYQERRIIRSFPNLSHNNDNLNNLLEELKKFRQKNKD